MAGLRPASWRLMNRYLNRALPVAHRDSVVAKVLMEVNSLVAPPGQLLHPRIVWRVLRPGRAAPPKPATGPD